MNTKEDYKPLLERVFGGYIDIVRARIENRQERAIDEALSDAGIDPDALVERALKQIEPQSGEIKSMRVVDRELGTGVGFALLSYLIAAARERGYHTLLLETGTGAGFAAANALYVRNGFVRRGPFADYMASDFNIFYERAL
jgi:GNAT superfamily N-acetyltransferase